MTIRLSDYIRVRQCQGNANNSIYVVRNKFTKEKAILKEINVIDLETQLREIKIHQKLDHENIIKLLDFSLNESKLTLLIEYAEGGDLYSLLPSIKIMSEKKVLRLFKEIVSALCYLHSKGIVHRDIKPENILLTANQKPKLADFGTSGDKGVIANTFCGTYEYMAPEIYMRQQHTDKVDVWAIGVLLFELTQRKVPFPQSDLDSIRKTVERKKIRFSKNTKPEVIDFIYQTLELNPQKRPPLSILLQHPLFDSITEDEKKEKVIMAKKVGIDVKRNLSTSVCKSKKSGISVTRVAKHSNISVSRVKPNYTQTKSTRSIQNFDFSTPNKNKNISPHYTDLRKEKTKPKKNRKEVMNKIKDINTKLKDKYGLKTKVVSRNVFDKSPTPNKVKRINLNTSSKSNVFKSKYRSVKNISPMSKRVIGKPVRNVSKSPQFLNITKKVVNYNEDEVKNGLRRMVKSRSAIQL